MKEEGRPAFRSGFVAILGRPNAGKSTLLNRVIGQKVTIVSDKPQTTRNRIQCVWTVPDAQVVFLDTPGIHRPRDPLGESMVRAAEEALEGVDVVTLVVDGPAGPGPGDLAVAERIQGVETPKLLVVNKIDRAEPGRRDEIVDAFRVLGSFDAVVPVSAMTGEGVDEYLARIKERLPEGPQYYPEDWMVDHPEQFVVSELIREKVFMLTHDEVPHSIAVEVEKMQRRAGRDLVDIEATILVERESQKGIVIGRGGALLRQIGSAARSDIERLLGTPVNLQLWVKVSRDWREKERILRSLGYR